MLEVGHYETKNNSHVHVRTKYAGSWAADFDWLEEPDACGDCKAVDVDAREHRLIWQCDVCEGGSAELFPIKT